MRARSSGLGPDDLARMRPGIVYVSLSAYSHKGPWAGRRGFDSLVQSASGLVYEHSHVSNPEHLPAQAIDYATGYLAAFGAIVALSRRAREGGSYLVRLSLAQTGRWISNLGRVQGCRDVNSLPAPTSDSIRDLMMQTDTPWGRLSHLAPVLHLSETPPIWSSPPVPLEHDSPTWLSD